MVYYFLFITLKIFQASFFDFKGILQHYEFENWRIGEFDFWCHEQGKKLCWFDGKLRLIFQKCQN